MDNQQRAAGLRIIAKAFSELADVLDGPGTASAASTPAAAPPASGSDLTSLPAWAQKRARYLQAFVDNGGQLTLAQVTAAAKAAGYGNPGSATSQGYVAKVGSDYHDPRVITPKGIAWLEAQTGKST